MSSTDKRKINDTKKGKEDEFGETVDPMKKKRTYIDVNVIPHPNNLSNRLEVTDLKQFLILEELYQPDFLLRWRQSSLLTVAFIKEHYLFSHTLHGNFPNLETYIHAKRLGITNYHEYEKLMKDREKAIEMGFENVDEYYLFQQSGFSTREEWLAARKKGFNERNAYLLAKQDGFDKFEEWQEFRKSPYLNARDFKEAKELNCKDPVSLYLYRILSDIEPQRSVAITKIQEMLMKALRNVEMAPSKRQARPQENPITFLNRISGHDIKQFIVNKLKNEPLFKKLGEYDDFGEVFQRK